MKLNKNSLLVPAFIPPIKVEKLSPSILDRLKGIRKEYQYLYSTCAWQLSFDKVGNDIYGIVHLISIFNDLKDRCLIISDPSNTYREYAVNNVQLSNNIYFINDAHSYFELLKKIDVFIRSTTTDGDALSVKEALFLGKHVIASDCISRPLFVTLYETNNFKDLKEKIIRLDFRKMASDSGALSGFNGILEIYNQLLYNSERTN